MNIVFRTRKDAEKYLEELHKRSFELSDNEVYDSLSLVQENGKLFYVSFNQAFLIEQVKVFDPRPEETIASEFEGFIVESMSIELNPEDVEMNFLFDYDDPMVMYRWFFDFIEKELDPKNILLASIVCFDSNPEKEYKKHFLYERSYDILKKIILRECFFKEPNVVSITNEDKKKFVLTFDDCYNEARINIKELNKLVP